MQKLVCGKGLSDANEDEALLRRAMIESAKRSILLIDSTKLNTVSFFSICPISKIDKIICDAPLPKDILSQVKGKG